MSDKILAGRYRLLEQIGFGGMAIVYKAMDEITRHLVAVKVLRPEYNSDAEFVSRFQREAEAASKMTHHNIVNLLDVGMDGENRYLVMEYVQGKTLKDVIREKGKLSESVAGQIAVRILSALQHAHSNGIIHRDIKPQNILVHENGHVKVADFGIARIANAPTLTKGDNVMGSVHYFSPEQARGEAADVTSDIYSVGVVLYEMLTGRVPYEGENPVAVAMQHIHGEPIPIRQIAPEVSGMMVHVCMTAMSKNPAYRYQSARDMATDLRAVLENRPDQMLNMASPEPERPAREEQRNGQGGQNGGKNKKTGNTVRRAAVLGVIIGLLIVAGLSALILKLVRDSNTSAPVPSVVGLEAQEARNVLEASGFECTIWETANTTYEAGIVFMQNPKSDETKKKGSVVALNVSTGPDSFELENLTGYSYQDASAILKEIGITPILNKVVSPDVAVGTVISQEPGPGTLISVQEPVQLNVSGGETWVPNLTGRSLRASAEMLTGYDLTLNPVLVIQTTDEEALHGTVATQTPAADTPVVLGTAVTLTMYSCPKREHPVSLALTLQPSELERNVKIMIQKEEDDFQIQAGAFVLQPDREAIVRTYDFTVPEPGSYIYRVFVNNEEVLKDLFTAE